MLLYIKRKARESVLLLLVRCLRLSHCPRSPNEQLQDSPRCTYNNKVHLLQEQRCTKVLTYPADIHRCFCFDFYSETCEISNSQRQKRSKRLSLIYIISVTSYAWLWLYKDSENCIISKLFTEKIAEFAIILELNGYSGCMEIGWRDGNRSYFRVLYCFAPMR